MEPGTIPSPSAPEPDPACPPWNEALAQGCFDLDVEVSGSVAYVVGADRVLALDGGGRVTGTYGFSPETGAVRMTPDGHRFQRAKVEAVLNDGPELLMLIGYGVKLPGPAKLLRLRGDSLVLDPRIGPDVGVVGAWTWSPTTTVVAERRWGAVGPSGPEELRVLGHERALSWRPLARERACKKTPTTVVDVQTLSDGALQARVLCGEQQWLARWQTPSAPAKLVPVDDSSWTSAALATELRGLESARAQWNRCPVPTSEHGKPLRFVHGARTAAGIHFVVACSGLDGDDIAEGVVFWAADGRT